MDKKEYILIVEGGGLKGIFSAGVLSVLGLEQLNISKYIGVSSGALNLAFILNKRVSLFKEMAEFCLKEKRLFNLKNIFFGKNIIDLDWLFNYLVREEKIDFNLDALDVACTEAESAKSFLIKSSMESVKASCAPPFYYKTPIELGGLKYIDGSFSNPLPIHSLIEKNIIVIRNKNIREPKTNTLEKIFFYNNKNYREALDKRALDYKEAIKLAHERNNIIVVEPKDIRTKFHSSSLDKINNDYDNGVNAGIDLINSLEGLIA